MMLPCPFCGGNDLSIHPDQAEDDGYRTYAYHVFCNDCHTRGRNLYPHCWCESEQQAIEAWNDRSIPAMIAGESPRYVQLSVTALSHIHRELENLSNIKNHIDDLLTPRRTNFPLSPPGDTMRDIMEERGISEYDLGKQLDIAPVTNLLEGRTAIDDILAIKLSRVLGSTPEFWKNRERHYRERR